MNFVKSGIFFFAWLSLSLSFNACGKFGNGKSTPGPEDKVYTVSVTGAVEREIPNSIQAEGRFIAVGQLEVKSDFTGKVQALSVEEGQSVYAGNVLMKIEDEKLPWILERQRAQLNEAIAQMELDEKLASGVNGEAFEEPAEEEPLEEEETYSQEEEYPEEEPVEEYEGEEDARSAAFRRLAQLRRQAARARRFNQGLQNQGTPATTPPPPRAAPSVSPEVAQSRETLNQAKIDRIRAEISETERQLDGSTITSGIDGFISRVSVAEGSLVKPGDLLAEIVTLDPIDLRLYLPKEDMAKIDKSMKVKVTVPDLGNRLYEGEISFIGASVDPAQQNVEIRVRILNRDEKVKLNMEGIANIALSGGTHQALVVPSKSLVRQEGHTYLYILKSNLLAERIEVSTGSAFEDLIEIKRGLDENDRVVTRGVEQLKGEEAFIQVRP